jgi:hypothetical protein
VRWALVAVALIACRSHEAKKEEVAAKPTIRVALPTVSASGAVVDTVYTQRNRTGPDDPPRPYRPPPLIVILERTGKLSVMPAPQTWEELSSVDPANAKPVDGLATIDQVLQQVRANHWTPKQLLAHLAPSSDERSDEDEDPDDPKLAEGRMALGYRADELEVAGGYYANFQWTDRVTPESDKPVRHADIAGEVRNDVMPVRLLVFADPKARAHDLIKLIGMSRAGIGVVHDKTIRALRFQIPDPEGTNSPPKHWLELRIPSMAQVEVESVPSKPAYIGPFDATAIRAAINKYMPDGSYNWSPVDILVGDLDVQQLIDAISTVELTGVHSIGLGPIPHARQLAR